MEIGDILQKYRDRILDEWVERLHKEVSSAYSSLSINALYSTCSAAFEANYERVRSEFFGMLFAGRIVLFLI